MFKQLFAGLLLSVMYPLFVVAAAADGLYIGARAGIIKNDTSGFDNATNAGVALGYEFLNVGVGDVAIEGEYTTTIDEGNAPGISDWETDTMAVYGVLRTGGPVYVQAKAGVINQKLDVGAISNDDTGFTVGLGIGFSLAVAQFELQYTRMEEDIDFVGIGINIKTPF